jgi:hypothetical protein
MPDPRHEEVLVGKMTQEPVALREPEGAKGYEAGALTTRVLEVTVTVGKIEAVRLSDRASENLKSNYKLNVDLTEKERKSQALTVNFSIELTCQPQLARIAVGGTARLVGPDAEIKDMLAAKGEKSPPKVVEVIYEKLYSLVYLIAGNMRVPQPLPSLVKSA